MLIHTHILYTNIGYLNCYKITTTFVKIVLSWWLLCNVECLICVLMTCSLLKQSIKIWLGSSGYFVLIIFRILCMPIISILKIFCKPW